MIVVFLLLLAQAFTQDCQQACTADYTPVCGTDGVTYGNLCALNNARCASSTLNVAHNGECCDSICTEEYSPVCGTNGVTYSNLCKLEAAKCEANNSFSFSRNGECCSPICTKEYRPVCGTNGQTYGNLCMFNYAKCEANNTFDLAYEGTCCPGGVRPAQCLRDPCQGATCAAYPSAQCEANYCGGCNADFYYNGNRVQCDSVSTCLNGLPIVQCLVDPCSVQSCDSYPNATCQANYCGGCHAEFFWKGKRVCVRSCSPSSWSSNLAQWNQYSPSDSFRTIFGVTGTGTLLNYLQQAQTSAKRKLGKEAVAALLNAATPEFNFKYSTTQVISKVQYAWQSPFLAQLVTREFQSANSGVCPFS